VQGLKEACLQENATVQNLLSKIRSLKEELGEQVVMNDALTEKNAELGRQLEKVKPKYRKSREAKKRMDKLRSQ
jgi:regulator of replication initiation timing